VSGQQTRPLSGGDGTARLLILGLGNPLMGDDGVGHAVIKILKGNDTPPGVRLEALAGDVLELADLWVGEPQVWLVDAINGGYPVGSLRVIEHHDLLALPADSLSTHHLSVSESLRWLLHASPEMLAVRFRLYGIEIGALRPELGLRPEVKEAAARLASVCFDMMFVDPGNEMRMQLPSNSARHH
jgi:hydrogenase maturation protease